MWSPRAQNDRAKFSSLWRETLENIKTLDLWQDAVDELVIKDKTVNGVKTQMGIEFKSKTVILTNGTFLNGLILLGNKKKMVAEWGRLHRIIFLIRWKRWVSGWEG
jgi:tRNA uridine 5-carboxymethylaminomethyl modification enzyme